MRTVRIVSIAVLIFAGLLCSGAASAAELTVPVEVRPFPADVPTDGFWSALTVASDGRVYMGLCKHGGTAHVLRYDPARDQIEDLGALANMTHEMWLGKEPQSKVHVAFQEGKDGKIYFATHFGNWWSHAREFELEAPYPGSHWLVYDPKVNRFDDLGIAAENEGVIAMAMDRNRNILYGMTMPRGHVVRYDISTGRTRDLGRVANWDMVVRWLVVDGTGRLYGSMAPNHVFRYDPQKDTIEQLPAVLPHNKDIPAARWGSTTGNAIWRTALYHERLNKIYGISAGSVDLFELDPASGEARLVAPMCPDEFIGRSNVPYASLALARAPGGDILYYAAQGSARRFDYGGTEGAGAKGPSAHLITYDLASGKRQDHGMITNSAGYQVLGSEGAGADAKGNVYFVGGVQKQGAPLGVGLMIYRTKPGRKNP